MSAGLGAVRCAQEARLKSPGDCAALDRGGDRDSGLLPRPQKKSAHFKAARLRGRRVLEAPRSAGHGGELPGAGVGSDTLARGLRAGCFLFLREFRNRFRASKNRGLEDAVSSISGRVKYTQ